MEQINKILRLESKNGELAEKNELESRDEMWRSNSIKLRKIYVNHLIKTGKDLPCLTNEPSSEIRLLLIPRIEEIAELIEHCKDENREIKIAVLKRIKTIRIEKSRQDEALTAISHYSNDCSAKIRIKFFRVLKVFQQLSSKLIGRLFDRKKNGMFIYGSDDESATVRKLIVKNILNFAREKTAQTVFEYLVDLLNDEEEKIRILVLRKMLKIAKSYKVRIENEHVLFISDCLEENNLQIRRGVLRVFARLSYSTVEIYKIILFSRNSGERENLCCLKSIIKRNHKLFYDDLFCSGPFSIFSHVAFERSHSLYDRGFIGELLLIFTLKRFYNFEINPRTLRLRNYLKLKMYNEGVKLDNDAVANIINNINNNIASVCSSNINADNEIRIKYFVALKSGIDAFFATRSLEPFIKFIFDFKIANFQNKLLAKILEIDENLHGREPDVGDRAVFLEYLESLNLQKYSKYIKKHGFVISGSLEFIYNRLSNSNIIPKNGSSNVETIHAKIMIWYKITHENIFLRVEEPNSGRFLYFPIAETIHFYLNQNISELLCCVVFRHSKSDFILSDLCKITK